MSDLEQIFLLPGEMHFAKRPTRIATLLGSCVAVALHDTRNGWGGMNHYLLPDSSIPGTAVGKAGDAAIAHLVRMAILTGCMSADLRATIVGGGQVAAHLVSVGKLGDIGARNIAAARQALAALGIPIIGDRTGGIVGRRVRFDSQQGTLEVDDIRPSADAERARALQGRALRVLIVDDSATVRGVLGQVIRGSHDLVVCGEASDPFMAREMIMEQEPDVICLDIIMPRLDGLSFLTRLMAYRPIPTVVVSTIAKPGSEMAARLKAAGAVAIIDKETLRLYEGLEVCRQALLPILRLAARTAVHAIGKG